MFIQVDNVNLKPPPKVQWKERFQCKMEGAGASMKFKMSGFPFHQIFSCFFSMNLKA